MPIVSGPFIVKMTPQAGDDHPQGAAIGRMLLVKTYDGALVGVSRGLMLAVRSEVEGSAGYVAIEFVTGKLEGKSGSFALQHFGTMKRGAPELRISVVPDSGTNELQGLSGDVKVNVTGGEHEYVFDYTIA